jgi:hypothetical protein
MSLEESQELLDYLFTHTSQSKYQYIHYWEDNDAVLWDNRAVHHRATSAPNTPRKLVRTTVMGEFPPQEVIAKEDMDIKRSICISNHHHHHHSIFTAADEISREL